MSQWTLFLAPFHSVLLHFPIGFLTMTFLLDLYGLRRPSAELRRAITFLMMTSIIAAIGVAVLGFWRASGGGYDSELLRLHRRGGVTVVALSIGAALAQRVAFRSTRRAPQIIYRGCFVMALVALVVTGHYGGSMAHGSAYLIRDAPEFVKELLGEGRPVPPAGDVNVQYFIEKVEPILDRHCYRCHGADAQAQGLRLDVREEALRGGASGLPAIVPMEPLRSEMVRRLVALREDPDSMPPKGAARLTASEVLTLIKWIERGAPYADDGPTPSDRTR